ncbi:MAG: hypothetical protein ABS920_05225 [Sporosarcina sp.]
MTMIFLLLLFIMQVIGFYFLTLLYTKVTKFDDLEKKQRNLMSEMDDSIGAYLSELKDENERLMERLTEWDKNTESDQRNSPIFAMDETAVSKESRTAALVNKPTTPVNLALKSYADSNVLGLKQSDPDVREVEDDRSRAFVLHDAGHSIEEIAKKLGKGRTEVELILKFR